MTACQHCPHFSSEHDRFDGHCRVRYYHCTKRGCVQCDHYGLCECKGWEAR